MRKIYPVAVGLLAIVAGGAAVYLKQKPLHAFSSRPRIAACLPSGTLILLSAPDPARTATDWKTTDLYKIWGEPEVKAFLEKPLSLLPASPELEAAALQAAKVDPKNLFVALTSLDEKESRPHLLAGFQFKGDSKEVDALLAKPKAWLRQSQPAGKADLVNYQGRAIETFETPDGDVLASAFLDDWYLIGNDVSLLKTTIDRLDHRTSAGTPSLDQDPAFQSVCAKLPDGPETLIFARSQPFLGRIFALAAASGQPVPAESRAEAEKLQAFGAATRIEDGKIHDTIYALAPGGAPGKLMMSSLPLTSADTLFYVATTFKVPATFNVPALPGTPANAGLAALAGWADAFRKQGISAETFRAALGDEASFQIDWPASNAQPAPVVSFDVRDRAAAQKLLDGLVAAHIEDGPAWQKLPSDKGVVLYTLNLPSVVFVSPTLTLTDKHVLAGLNPDDVRAAATRESTGGGAMAQTPGYKSAAAAVVKPNVAFAYVDAKAFFDRAYGVLKPAATMGAAIFAPQLGDYVDVGKLPGTETISRHLSPTVFSEAVDSQGITVESLGSVTVAQAIAGLAIATGAAAEPMLQKQYGLPTAPAAPVQKKPQTPSAAPPTK